MVTRRTFTAGVAAGSAVALGAFPSSPASASGAGLGPVRHVSTELLDIAYHDVGPRRGRPVILGHGWPYSPRAYAEVAPALAGRGHRVIVPYLRGHGPTRFRSASTIRSGQQAALGADVISLMDALHIEKAIFGGYDWGGRGLNVAAALWPDRCTGLVSVNSYLVQNLSPALIDLPLDSPATESAHWYYYFFLTERGRAGLTKYKADLARVVWARNSPEWEFTDAEFADAVALMDNPDYVDVVLHVYRHRRLVAAGDPRYDALEAKLLTQPPITMPAVTLDGLSDGSIPATDGTPSAAHFTGPRVHHRVPRAGHNLPQERPDAFVRAVLEVAKLR